MPSLPYSLEALLLGRKREFAGIIPDVVISEVMAANVNAAAADDGAVTPLGACRYAECLLAAGAGAALHLYPSGGHGFGLRREFAWREALVGELRMWLDATIGTV